MRNDTKKKASSNVYLKLAVILILAGFVAYNVAYEMGKFKAHIENSQNK